MSGLISGGVGVLGFGIGIVAKPVATAAANAIRKFTTGGVKPPPAAVSSNAASCVANSFALGTGVLMADGSSKPIETLDLGDSVLATDPETGTTAAEPVVRLITGSGEKDLVTLTVVDENGKTASVEATAGHPFWVPEQQQWISAGDLQPGMWLQTASGTWVMLSAVAYEHREQTVYNLTIDTIHTFYVLADDQPLLAHNCGTAAVGFADDAVGTAFENMPGGGGHAIRHLQQSGIISNTGSLASRVSEFASVTRGILQSPTATFNHALKGPLQTRGFLGTSGDQSIAVFVAKEGPYQGNVVSAFVPSPSQMANWLAQ